MDLIHAIILGIVEGITEFLPISSTGHLILTSDLLKLEQTEFVKTFSIAIQTGAILSVVALYWKKLLGNYKLIKQIIVAFIPTAIIGFVLYKFIKQHLLGNPEVVLFALFFGGIILIGAELLFKSKSEPQNPNSKKIENLKFKIENSSALSYEKAFAIGVFQSISVVPGVSRAASTIIGGLLVGLDRKTATEFSFLLAIPTLLAATLLDLKETNFYFTSSELIALFVGTITSFIVATIVIKWFIKYVQNNTFIPFGIYRIVLSIAYFVLIIN